DGEDVARVGRIGLYLAAQPVDVRVYVVLVAFEGGSPDRVEQLHPGEGAPRVAGEVLQQLELLRRQGEGAAVEAHFAAGGVDLEFADAQALRRGQQLGCLHFDSSQHGLDPRLQFRNRKGLGQVV